MHLFDSNILIYHLNDLLPPSAARRAETWITEGAFTSVVTRIEVLGYPDQSSDQAHQASALLNLFTELPLREPVIQTAIRLRRGQSIRLGDAIIATTAVEHDLALITRNTGDFEWVDGLSLINPFGD